MILAGLGNASFHVGAGAITLCASEGRSAPNGIFVAPGALGLTFGLWFGRSGAELMWPFYVVLGVSFAWTLLLPVPDEHRVRTRVERDRPPGAPDLGRVRFAHVIVVLLLVSIVVRSLVGYSGAYQCPSGPLKLFGLGAAAFGGKALGGIVSDRLGWMEVSVGALLLSAPFIAFGGPNIELLLIGMFLFQMTMPVTLSAVALCYPKRPGLAFGLTALALIIGVLPTFSQAATQFYGPGMFLALILASALSVWLGLRMLGDRNPIRGMWSARRA
jgi:FSR family fosmidomycin resistance protein-like MFS transporter